MTGTANQLMGNFQRMDAGRRLLLIGGAVVAVAAIWMAGQWGATPTYVSLYRDVDLKEAGEMSDHLRKANIPFKLGGGGTELMVPVSEVASARVALAKEGLPSSGRPGLELFDKPSWGMTDFTQRVTYQRALEGELSRTISGIRGVERAEVHLVMPVSSPLRRLERPASASVVVKVKPGTELPRESVQGIVYMVSNSVEQLASDNVAVMDDAGKVLSVPAEAGSPEGLSTRQLEVQHAVEQRLEEKVEDLLATVVGASGARTRVAAELDFDQVDRTTETYNPDGQVIQTEQRSEAGAAGANDAQTIVSNAYQNSRQVEKNVSSVGDLKRLTVAVLVDARALEAQRAKGGPQLAQIESLVRDAVGADSTRGDRVSVLAVPFETVSVPAAVPAALATPKMDVVQVVERASRPAVSVVAIVAVLLVALAGLRGALRPSTRPAGAPEPAFTPALNGAESPSRSRLPAEGNGELSADVVKAWLAES